MQVNSKVKIALNLTGKEWQMHDAQSGDDLRAMPAMEQLLKVFAFGYAIEGGVKRRLSRAAMTEMARRHLSARGINWAPAGWQKEE